VDGFFESPAPRCLHPKFCLNTLALQEYVVLFLSPPPFVGCCAYPNSIFQSADLDWSLIFGLPPFVLLFPPSCATQPAKDEKRRGFPGPPIIFILFPSCLQSSYMSLSFSSRGSVYRLLILGLLPFLQLDNMSLVLPPSPVDKVPFSLLLLSRIFLPSFHPSSPFNFLLFYFDQL